MKNKELILQAIQSIKANLLRSSLTMLIIAIGIMALVGILSAIDAIKASINNEFSGLGANTFFITEKTETIKKGGRFRPKKISSPITYYQA
ncbi:MAG: ABC transporter permease, partial [Bacteroidia bacterium]|nr:ABC transporter permease [Bacteroidia bacterium]